MLLQSRRPVESEPTKQLTLSFRTPTSAHASKDGLAARRAWHSDKRNQTATFEVRRCIHTHRQDHAQTNTQISQNTVQGREASRSAEHLLSFLPDQDVLPSRPAPAGRREVAACEENRLMLSCNHTKPRLTAHLTLRQQHHSA